MVRFKYIWMLPLTALLMGITVPASWGGDTHDPTAPTQDRFAAMRKSMVETQIEKRGVQDIDVLEAMMSVPRHCFVPENYTSLAYDDSPLPIGYGQTISQPFMVAYMTEILKLTKDDTVIEIGTGSGYQAAVLSCIVKKVYSIEIIPELAQSAAATLEKLGYDNVEVKNADGYYGWPELAPFDAIIVTAAAGHIPPPLVKQLKEGGRMIIPVGGRFMTQNLVLVIKKDVKNIVTHNVMAVRFVPLTGKR